MITTLLLNLLFSTFGEDNESPSESTDGWLPVIVVHLDGRRISGFLSDLEADPLSVLLLDNNNTTTVPKRMVDTLRVLKGAMSEPKPCVVLLKDGSQRRGMLLEDGFEGVRLQVGPLTERFELSKVAGVRWRPTVAQEIAARKATFRSNDPAEMAQFIRWLILEGHVKPAADELKKFAEDFPEAGSTLKNLQEFLSARLKTGDETPKRTSTPRRPTLPSGALTPSEVNRIRFWEYDFENPSPVRIPSELRRTFHARHLGKDGFPDLKTLRRLPDHEFLQLLCEMKDRDLYDEVQLTIDPPALDRFRRTIHDRWLLPKCGSCHTREASPGGFGLETQKANKAEVRMLNLLLLEQARASDGAPLLNWQNPAESRLLDLGKDPRAALHPHPKVEGYSPVFHRGREALVTNVIEWLEMMYRPRPDLATELNIQWPRNPANSEQSEGAKSAASPS
ncbi:MAG: hypothetical protein VX109_01870 [Planctomycetota bacterium]|nr:hypothetical protein [Planctomycetota bacterium]